MKYFVCDLYRIHGKPNVCLGIPTERTERIIPSDRIQAAVYETENQEAYISLPALFRLEDAAAPHGLVLKTSGPVKTVLLAPRIDIDLEISEEDIRRLPEALAEMLVFFRGISFSGEKAILILDPEKLLESIRRS